MSGGSPYAARSGGGAGTRKGGWGFVQRGVGPGPCTWGTHPVNRQTDRQTHTTENNTLPQTFMRVVMNIKEKVNHYLKFLCSCTMNLITVPFLGLLLSTAHSLEINEDDFNKVTSQLRQVSQELQEYKVKFGDIKSKLIKPDYMLRAG